MGSTVANVWRDLLFVVGLTLFVLHTHKHKQQRLFCRLVILVKHCIASPNVRLAITMAWDKCSSLNAMQY